jgi:hypothetical protein
MVGMIELNNGQPPGKLPFEHADAREKPPDDAMPPKNRFWGALLATALVLLDVSLLILVFWYKASSSGTEVIDVLFVLFIIPFPVVGWLIAVKQGRNPLGWIYLSFPIVLSIGFAVDELGLARAQTVSDPRAALLLIAGSWITFAGYWLLLGPGILLFPDGRFFSDRFRAVVAVVVTDTLGWKEQGWGI